MRLERQQKSEGCSFHAPFMRQERPQQSEWCSPHAPFMRHERQQQGDGRSFHAPFFMRQGRHQQSVWCSFHAPFMRQERQQLSEGCSLHAPFMRQERQQQSDLSRTRRRNTGTGQFSTYATAALLRHKAKSSRLSTGKTQRSTSAAEEFCKAASWIGGGGCRSIECGGTDELEDC
jgi:hypothetical protein